MMPEWISLPGLTDYDTGLELMHRKVQNIISNKEKEAIFLLEHPDIYTAGRSYKSEELLDNDLNIPIIYTERGGKFTYHGPGQRVIYPILSLANRGLKDLRLYVGFLEQWIINTLDHFGIGAYTVNGKIGIWTKDNNIEAKIAAIGIRVRKWVAYHGIALNIDTDLNKYSGIIPCGIKDFPVTSMAQMRIKIKMKEFDEALKKEFDKFF